MGIIAMSVSALKKQAFKFKGRLYTLTVAELQETEIENIDEQLKQIIEQAPNLFKSTPVVIDCTSCSENNFDLIAIVECFKKYGLIPVALQHASPSIEAQASYLGLALLNATAAHDKPVEIKAEKSKTKTKKNIETKLITTPVRSGQQVVALGSDLIATGKVSHGAELLADGHIHVYGALRGRALAGMNGNKNARIFCQSLEAELVSIAGYYLLSDEIKPYAGPVQIYLKNEQIHIEPL